MSASQTFPYGQRPIGSELEGSTIVGTTDTAYRLADGRFVGKAKVDRLTPVTPLVTFW